MTEVPTNWTGKTGKFLSRTDLPLWISMVGFVATLIASTALSTWINGLERSHDRQYQAISTQLSSLQQEANDFSDTFMKFALTIIKPEMAREFNRTQSREDAVAQIETLRTQLLANLLRQQESASDMETMIEDADTVSQLREFERLCLDLNKQVRAVNTFDDLKPAFEKIGAWKEARDKLLTSLRHQAGLSVS